MLDSDEDEDLEDNTTRAAGPAIGVSTLDQKRPAGLQELKMPKIKGAGESVQKAQSRVEPPSPLTANKTRVQRHNLKPLQTKGLEASTRKDSGGSSRSNSASRSFGLTIDTKTKEETKDSEVIERFNTLRGEG